jgi:integrase
MVVSITRRNYFRPALRVLGLQEMRVHDLRHTAASLWLAAGFEPYKVSRWLGQANLSTTDMYSHLYPGDYSHHVARFAAFKESGIA